MGVIVGDHDFYVGVEKDKQGHGKVRTLFFKRRHKIGIGI
jgi:hypothetical protein